MHQYRLTIIRSLFSLRALVLQVPRNSQLLDAPRQQIQASTLTFHQYLTQATTAKTDDQKSKRQQQKITLIAQNQSLSVTTLDEAQKLAKRRDLHLLPLNEQDAKTGRPIFKLVTAAEMLADVDREAKGNSKSAAEKKKSEKSLTIGSRITDHDLASRLKNITKWLNKRHEVRVLIQGNSSGADESSVEHIVQSIEATIKQPEVIGKIVQKRQKSGFIKFNIVPVNATPASQTTVNQS